MSPCHGDDLDLQYCNVVAGKQGGIQGHVRAFSTSVYQQYTSQPGYRKVVDTYSISILCGSG